MMAGRAGQGQGSSLLSLVFWCCVHRIPWSSWRRRRHVPPAGESCGAPAARCPDPPRRKPPFSKRGGTLLCVAFFHHHRTRVFRGACVFVPYPGFGVRRSRRFVGSSCTVDVPARPVISWDLVGGVGSGRSERLCWSAWRRRTVDGCPAGMSAPPCLFPRAPCPLRLCAKIFCPGGATPAPASASTYRSYRRRPPLGAVLGAGPVSVSCIGRTRAKAPCASLAVAKQSAASGASSTGKGTTAHSAQPPPRLLRAQ